MHDINGDTACCLCPCIYVMFYTVFTLRCTVVIRWDKNRSHLVWVHFCTRCMWHMCICVGWNIIYNISSFSTSVAIELFLCVWFQRNWTPSYWTSIIFLLLLPFLYSDILCCIEWCWLQVVSLLSQFYTLLFNCLIWSMQLLCGLIGITETTEECMEESVEEGDEKLKMTWTDMEIVWCGEVLSAAVFPAKMKMQPWYWIVCWNVTSVLVKVACKGSR